MFFMDKAPSDPITNNPGSELKGARTFIDYDGIRDFFESTTAAFEQLGYEGPAPFPSASAVQFLVGLQPLLPEDVQNFGDVITLAAETQGFEPFL